jgi:ribosome maturation factor RimP
MRGDSRHASSRQGRADRRGTRGGPAPARAQSRPAVPGPDPDELARLLEPVIRAAGMDLEAVRVAPAGRRRLLRVVVDADGGPGLDVIAEVSRDVSARLDATRVMGEMPYTLEVSSPGVDRPLTLPRHWRRAAGRLVSVPLADASEFFAKTAGAKQPPPIRGRVLAASDTGVTLDVDGARREFAYSELGPGRVQVEFGRPADTGTGGDDAGPPESGEAGAQDEGRHDGRPEQVAAPARNGVSPDGY